MVGQWRSQCLEVWGGPRRKGPWDKSPQAPKNCRQMNMEFLTFCGIIKMSFVLTATNIMYSDNELGAYLNPIAPAGYGAEKRRLCGVCANPETHIGRGLVWLPC